MLSVCAVCNRTRHWFPAPVGAEREAGRRTMSFSPCLVTGASGFIGGRLVERLLATTPPAGVYCLIPPHRLHTPRAEAWRERGVTLIAGDLMARPVSEEPPPSVKTVFHLAANIDTAAPAEAMRLNDRGTATLLDWLSPTLGRARVVYASSVAVMDRTGPAQGPLTEDSPCTPRTEYGASKLRAEHVIQERAPGDGFSFSIIRLPTVYGPGQKAGGLFDTLGTLAEKRHWLARLDWPGRTSVLHVEDAVRILTEFATGPEARNGIYCVAGPGAPTVGELARAVAAACGRDLRPIRPPRIVWSMLRSIAFSRRLPAVLPAHLHVWLWRLSLLVDHGFWVDPSRYERARGPRPRPLDVGLRETFGH